MIIYKCDSPYTEDRLHYKVPTNSLGYNRKMTYISSPHLLPYYLVEGMDGYFYFPYLSLSSLCIRVSEEGEAVVLVRGKEHKTYQLDTRDKIKKFFDTLGDRYISYHCMNHAMDILNAQGSNCVYDWNGDYAYSVDELYTYTKNLVGYSPGTRHTTLKDATILDVCSLIYDLSDQEYFIFDFDEKGEVAFTREEVRRYKTTGRL